MLDELVGGLYLDVESVEQKIPWEVLEIERHDDVHPSSDCGRDHMSVVLVRKALDGVEDGRERHQYSPSSCDSEIRSARARWDSTSICLE